MIFKLITLIIACISPVSNILVSPISAYFQSSSSIITIYQDSITPASPSTYTVGYETAKTVTPQIAMGITSYKENSDMSSTLFTLVVSSNTLANFQIQYDFGGSASVYTIKISYISLVDEYDNTYVIQKAYINTDFSNINQGTGSRTDSKVQSFFTLSGGNSLNSDNSKNLVTTFMTGFEVALTNTFFISVVTTITNSISFTVAIQTSDDCKIYQLKANFIFADTQQWEGTSIEYYDSIDTIISGSTEVSNLEYVHLATNHFIYGIKKLEATLNGASMQTYFSFTIASSGITFDLTFSSNIDSLDTQFLFIGTRQCPQGYPYYSSPSIQFCTDECAEGQTQTPQNFICNPCVDPCQTCDEEVNLCLSCIENYEYDGNVTCTENPTEPNPPTPPQAESFPLWTIGVIVPGVILISVGLYCLLRKPPRTLFEEDIRMHPSIDML